MIQRFSLLVWPDAPRAVKVVDRDRDDDAADIAFQTYRYLASFDPRGAEPNGLSNVPFLRFADDAQDIFLDWLQNHEDTIAAHDLSPAFESHLNKYPKLVASLALINHIAAGQSGPIGKTPLLQALAMAQYLESHARRAYGAGAEAEITTAKAILAKIRKGDLRTGFTSREITQRGWSGLSDEGQPKPRSNCSAITIGSRLKSFRRGGGQRRSSTSIRRARNDGLSRPACCGAGTSGFRIRDQKGAGPHFQNLQKTF